MPRKETLTDVPADKVNGVVQEFKDAGASDVKKTKQDNGKYTVVATFPDNGTQEKQDGKPEDA